MIGTRTLARTLLAGIFVAGGANALRKSKQLVPVAEPVTDQIVESTGVDARTERLIQVNAGLQIAGGAALVFGILPRVAAIGLGASLIPTTIAGHPFWEADTEEEKEAQTMGFLKNAAILGGLLFAALDTGGRPSVFWSGKHAAINAADAVSGGAQRAIDRVTN